MTGWIVAGILAILCAVCVQGRRGGGVAAPPLSPELRARIDAMPKRHLPPVHPRPRFATVVDDTDVRIATTVATCGSTDPDFQRIVALVADVRHLARLPSEVGA